MKIVTVKIPHLTDKRQWEDYIICSGFNLIDSVASEHVCSASTMLYAFIAMQHPAVRFSKISYQPKARAVPSQRISTDVGSSVRLLTL